MPAVLCQGLSSAPRSSKSRLVRSKTPAKSGELCRKARAVALSISGCSGPFKTTILVRSTRPDTTNYAVQNCQKSGRVAKLTITPLVQHGRAKGTGWQFEFYFTKKRKEREKQVLLGPNRLGPATAKSNKRFETGTANDHHMCIPKTCFGCKLIRRLLSTNGAILRHSLCQRIIRGEMRAGGLVATRGIEPRRGAWELCRAK